MAKLVHFEIHASDPVGLIDFYQDVFGWGIKEWPGADGYWLITESPGDEQRVIGGILRRKGEPPSAQTPINAFVCTFQIADIDLTIAAIQRRGGRVSEPKMKIETVGWVAQVIDPNGSIFGLLQPP